jgi:hypothetical protein
MSLKVKLAMIYLILTLIRKFKNKKTD